MVPTGCSGPSVVRFSLYPCFPPRVSVFLDWYSGSDPSPAVPLRRGIYSRDGPAQMLCQRGHSGAPDHCWKDNTVKIITSSNMNHYSKDLLSWFKTVLRIKITVNKNIKSIESIKSISCQHVPIARLVIFLIQRCRGARYCDCFRSSDLVVYGRNDW